MKGFIREIALFNSAIYFHSVEPSWLPFADLVFTHLYIMVAMYRNMFFFLRIWNAQFMYTVYW